MSNSIGWRATPLPKTFSKVMRTTPSIIKRLFGERWALQQQITVTHQNDAYFRGLADVGYDGAQEILDAIAEHGSVDLELGE